MANCTVYNRMRVLDAGNISNGVTSIAAWTPGAEEGATTASVAAARS